MNADLTPALVAAGGGSAMLAGICIREARMAEAMRASRIPLSLRYPHSLDPAGAVAALDGLSGFASSAELVIEVSARQGSITHGLWVPEADRSSVEAILSGTIGSLRIGDGSASPQDGVTLALRLFVPTPAVLASGDLVAASRSLLTGLANLRSGEQVIVRWALRPGSSGLCIGLTSQMPVPRR